MDSLIEELEQKTMYCVQQIDLTTYEQIAEIIQLRDRLIQELDLVVLEKVTLKEYRERIVSLLHWDSLLFERALELREQAVVQLNKLQNAHQQKKAYDGEHQTTDSLFFDKKK